MSENRKQEGSNILSAEAYTGRCPIQCELCYVNFGEPGQAKVKGIRDGKGNIAASTREFAERHGWKGGPFRIWLRPAAEWYDHGPRMFRLPTGYVLPAILRISSCGDSSMSPAAWCRDIKALWGSSCFFNSTIRAIKQRPANLRDEVFHKLVVTTNGGYQKVYEHVDPMPTYAIKNAQYFFDKVYGTMDPPSAAAGFANFLDPHTLTSAGFAEHEGRIKFYRLRTLPTVVPWLETDKPVVHTMVRFKGVWNACEFARAYGMELEVDSADGFRRNMVERFGFRARKAAKGTHIRIRMASEHNSYPHQDEWTHLVHRKSYYRVDPEQFGPFKYVCDRIYKSCKGCGLCATLDAQYEDDTNPIMAEFGFRPKPFEGGYVEKQLSRAGRMYRNPEEELRTVSDDAGSVNGSFFEGMLDDIYLCSNPDGSCVVVEQSEEWLERALWECGSYCLSNGYYVEDWDTHEDVGTLIAYCVWCMLRKARRGGMGPEQAWDAARGFAEMVTEGAELLAANADLMLMWNNEGPYIEQFGTLDAQVPVL
jgi:hypothetical protein